jgi:hypothetical protein
MVLACRSMLKSEATEVEGKEGMLKKRRRSIG